MGSGAEEAEALEAFVAQFYSNKPVPRLLLLSHEVENADLVEAVLSERAGRRVRLAVPRRGEKLELVTNAMRNAREALTSRLAEHAAQASLMARMAELLELSAPPSRIEVYDNSHLQGSNAIGAMIVASTEGFLKSDYRKFNIRSDSLTPGDDFAMMREMLGRRFKRLVDEDPERETGNWPDLVIIDGGAGHVSAAREVMIEFGVDDLPLLGVLQGTGPQCRERRVAPARPASARFATQRKSPLSDPAPA